MFVTLQVICKTKQLNMSEESTYRASQQQSLGPNTIEREQVAMQQAQRARAAGGVPCPKCGTVNDPDAMYCESCGAQIRLDICPNCSSHIDPDADYCEVCHHYVRHDICSFCGAALSDIDAFCPECGSPRGGIVCPNCHALNDFAFCKQCGQALTEEARHMVEQVRRTPEYLELKRLAQEYNELQMQLPYATERDKLADEQCDQLRLRVLRLLAQDEGVKEPVIPEPAKPRMSKEELDRLKAEKLQQLAQLLEATAALPQPRAAQVRNYAMAQKPAGVRMAWVCNYKKALHSSPCGCAKPQLGGKWIVLGQGMQNQIKDDK